MATVRDRILASAAHCFQTRGAKQTRVQDICEQAAASRTSFYREFRNVDDVLANIAMQRWSDMLAHTVSKVEKISDAQQRWSNLIDHLAAVLREQPELKDQSDTLMHTISLMYTNDNHHLCEMGEIIRPLIERDQRNGVLRSDLSLLHIVDWLFRQAWALSSVPLPDKQPEALRSYYIDQFILPGLLQQQDNLEKDVSQKKVLQRLDVLEKTIKALSKK